MIALAVNFSGNVWSESDISRVRSALCQGLGGEPRVAAKGPIILAARSSLSARASLSTTDELTNHVAFHGELHDRAALRELLVREGRRDSDADLYRYAFDRFGRSCDEHIVGRYAALAWCANSRRVHGAASAIEAQPLFWGRRSDMLVVASTPQVHFALGFERRLCEDRLTTAFSGTPDALSQSWFEGISRVPPGHAIELSESSDILTQFWSLDSIAPVHGIADDEAVDETRRLLQKGMNAALQQRRQPAMSLSGGLDSQIVAAHLAERSDCRVRAYCAVPEPGYRHVPRKGSFADEGAHAEALGAMHPNLQVSKVDAAGAHFTDDLDAILKIAGIPPLNALNLPWLHALMGTARAQGADVLLSAGYGNLTMSHDGLDAFSIWARSGRLKEPVNEALALKDGRPGWRKIIAHVAKPRLPRALLRAVAAKRALARPHDRGLSLEERAGVPTRADRLRYADLAMAEGSEIDAALELKHGIALRDPTAYRPFVEFCLSLPPEQFLRAGETRFLARRLGKGKIPERVRRETRIGYQSADWPVRMLRQRDALLQELKRIQTDERLARGLNFSSLIADFESWDGSDRVGSGAFYVIANDVTRAIVLGRFVRWVESGGK